MTALPLHRFATATASFAFFVLFAGGMVTSTGSGLAVPDWPLSYGQYFPAMVGGVFFEHGHRMVAGLVGLGTLALAIWAHFREDRRWVKRLTLWALFGVCVQAVLGGVTVLYGLPSQVSIIHAVLGQTLFCVLIVVAQATSPWYRKLESAPSQGNLWRRGRMAVAILYIQLILGATVRHTGAAVAFHVLWAFAAMAAVLSAAFRARASSSPEPSIQPLSALMAALVLAQMLLGIGAFFARHSRTIHFGALLPTAHQAVGALILGLTVLWTLRAYRSGAS